MRRRRFLSWLGGLLPASSLFGRFGSAAPRVPPIQAIPFDGRDVATLRHIAASALPSSLGEKGVDEIVARFVRWLGDYPSGVAAPHQAGRSDAPRTAEIDVKVYEAQLHAIAIADAARSSTPLTAILEKALVDAGIDDLPSRPDGGHVVSDLMSFYFGSSDANDLCYRSNIGRKSCRGLPGLGDEPQPLPVGNSAPRRK